MSHIEQYTISEGQKMMPSAENCNQMVDCMLNNPPSPSPPPSSNFCCEGVTAATNEEKTSVQQGSPAVKNLENKAKNKRKRARATKTSEEVEKQRMIHIEVERNRRKQMNEHLQILRSLMPASYAQRGDQASIVGGAIEFVRELEQLLQCLESVKRQHAPSADDPCHQGPLILSMTLDHHLMMDQTAESKSWLADVEANLSGFFGSIKILSRRRPGQLIKNIAALEHLQLHILQTNITTIQEDVVCSFSVMMNGEAMFTAEDIAHSIQQILLSCVHANSSVS